MTAIFTGVVTFTCQKLDMAASVQAALHVENGDKPDEDISSSFGCPGKTDGQTITVS